MNPSKAFRTLLLYRIGATLSYQITMVAVGWHLYEITNSVVSLGLIGLAELIPYFALALYSGHAVDHYSRKLIAGLACLIHIAVALFLAAIAIGWITPPVPFIYVAVAFIGVGRALLRPSYQALFGQIIPRDQLTRYTAYASSAFQICVVAGPGLGGLMIGFAGLEWTYCLAAGCGAFGLYGVTFIRAVQEKSGALKNEFFKSFMEGFRYVRKNELILSVMALDMFAVLFGGAVSILPAFVKEVLNAGPETLGILRAAPAAGAVITGIYLARRPILTDSGKYLFLSVAGFGMAIIAFGISSNLWVCAFFLFISGCCDSISVVIRGSIMQLTTPNHMRGRISAINGIFIGSSNELGALESGIAASVMGLVPSIVFGGAATILVVLITYRLAPHLRKLNIQDIA
ncbi:MFS transporter [Polynucleobacter sp. 15G-AUS-farblos]|uniref:MFS transporter n=1 Tax=Polynucleobacter sp. 15G-AUS-farblos TaxID=2689094 RepID=UPI001C0AB7D3|nr:MFS transporter [Polynucleobacter sp. 15G-AUS-farblos]MBU3582838.1 MFS transporter [Polynucleobacter sp. 15G-AUS-farblos]